MAATASTTDSGLSGNPSDNIDKQTGPKIGTNVESPSSALGPITKPVQDGNNPSHHESTDHSGSGGHAQQPNAGGAPH